MIMNMKKYLLPLIVLALVAGGFWYWQNNKPAQSNNNQNNSDLVLFYGDGCPHCAKVDEFLKNNGAEDLYLLYNAYRASGINSITNFKRLKQNNHHSRGKIEDEMD